MTGRFEKTIFHAWHQILFILEKVKLIGYELLEKFIASFPFDETVDEIRLGYFRVHKSIKTVWFKYNYFWCLVCILTREIVGLADFAWSLFLFFVWRSIFRTVLLWISIFVFLVFIDLSWLSFLKILYLLVQASDNFRSRKVLVFSSRFSRRSDQLDWRLEFIRIGFLLSSGAVGKGSSRRLRNFLLLSFTDLLLVRHPVKNRTFRSWITFLCLYFLLNIFRNLFQGLLLFYNLRFLN